MTFPVEREVIFLAGPFVRFRDHHEVVIAPAGAAVGFGLTEGNRTLLAGGVLIGGAVGGRLHDDLRAGLRDRQERRGGQHLPDGTAGGPFPRRACRTAIASTAGQRSVLHVQNGHETGGAVGARQILTAAAGGATRVDATTGAGTAGARSAEPARVAAGRWGFHRQVLRLVKDSRRVVAQVFVQAPFAAQVHSLWRGADEPVGGAASQHRGHKGTGGGYEKQRGVARADGVRHRWH